MENEILNSLLKRPGLDAQVELLEDMIRDSMDEIRALLNYEKEEPLPEGVAPIVKELTLIRFNRDGTEGIQSESQSSGGSTTYSDDCENTGDCRGDGMSINRDMKECRLIKEVFTRTTSGVQRRDWKVSGTIQAAIYKKNESKMYGSEVYLQATHTGVTRSRNVKAGDRLESDGVMYLIEDCNPDSRLTNLILKVIENG